MQKSLTIFIILLSTLVGGFAQIAESAEDISPLMISEKIPGMELIDLEGGVVNVMDVIKDKPSIFLFYRGGWCPYCNRHLSAVGEVEDQIKDLGYQIIGISPDSPDNLNITAEKGSLKYGLLSDASGAFTSAMGLAFQAPERYGQRLEKYSGGQNSGILPVPAIYIIDTDGTILFQYVSPDYKQRMSSELLLDVLKSLNRKDK